MSRSRRKAKRKGCRGYCYDDGWAKVNGAGYCHACAAKLAKVKDTRRAPALADLAKRDVAFAP